MNFIKYYGKKKRFDKDLYITFIFIILFIYKLKMEKIQNISGSESEDIEFEENEEEFFNNEEISIEDLE